MTTDKDFFERFSFISTSGDPTKDCMVWGFECGDGWHDLLWELCEAIEEELQHFVQSEDSPFRVEQVKEKYGTLRFYTNWGTDRIYELIQDAENKSAVTCEVCGKPGKLRGTGWLSTTCEEHKEDI